jgi:hypothetical protein
MKSWLALVSLGVVTGLGGSAVADDDHDGHNRGQRVFRAQLTGYNEVPSASTPARGQFYAILTKDDELKYWLSFSDLVADVSQAHIHFGQHHTNGGIIVWLCSGSLTAPTPDTPACGGTRSGTASGLITADDIIGVPDRGIAATEFAELIAAMRAGAAYANVHSASTAPQPPAPAPGTQFPGGEIRGQIH